MTNDRIVFLKLGIYFYYCGYNFRLHNFFVIYTSAVSVEDFIKYT